MERNGLESFTNSINMSIQEPETRVRAQWIKLHIFHSTVLVASPALG